MTREINSTFEYGGKTYKVVEDTLEEFCNDCAFFNRCANGENLKDITGDCFDFPAVKFELVTNNKE